jgi:Concanavalin A-like lectin/glucanases superfamily
MKMSARLMTLALIAVPAVPSLAVPAAAATGDTQAAASATVARYTFDAGASAAGTVADTSGRGGPLKVRNADGGAVRFVAGKTGRAAGFPAPCAKGAKTCARALLEAADDADLNPGTGRFGWGASILVTKAQVVGSSNIMQKGASTADSQWKMQIGAALGKAQCVVVGKGSATAFVARSTGTTITDGAWHRILCQRSGTELSVSVDGVVRGKVAIPAALSVVNTRPMRIGGPNFNTTSDMYHGLVDDVYAILG